MRICTVCGEAKPLESFSKGCAQCKACRKQSAHAYYESNKLVVNAKNAKRRRETWKERKDHVLAVAAVYRAAHKEEERSARAAHYQRNKEHVAVVSKAYRGSHPELYTEAHARRSAAEIQATPVWANRIKIRGVYAEARRLTMETGVEHHVDHIVPLRGKMVCGLHVENNLQILTKTENLSKLNKFLEAAE